VRFGQPWHFILAVSHEMDADLIVVGSPGHHGLDRILGTTAARVANVSRRNVLGVHGRSDRAEDVEAVAGPYRQSSR
jgi:nucleotide-binding universal stress UspA family protein